MANMLRNRSGTVLLSIAAVAVFIILNLGASALTGVRVDLTQDKLFTLSDGTKNILKSMNKPATLTLYYSRELGEAAPPFGLHVTRVRDILKEFAAVSAGNLTIVEKEPEPFCPVTVIAAPPVWCLPLANAPRHSISVVQLIPVHLP